MPSDGERDKVVRHHLFVSPEELYLQKRTAGLSAMFQTKICGITDRASAAAVASAGVDAIGLNFYSGSRRYVSIEQAEAIVADLPGDIIRVGLFVDATDDEVSATYDRLQLDLVQLHGSEPPEFIASLGERAVMKAFRLGTNGLAPIAAYLDQCRSLGCSPELVLIDADVPGQLGGTGQTADWNLLVEERELIAGERLVLAGGLTAKNVGDAIRQVAPDAVDTASGVELDCPHKDEELSARFVAVANAAFSE